MERPSCALRWAAATIGLAVAFGLGLSSPAQAQDLELTVALEGGAAWLHERAVYDPFEWSDSDGPSTKETRSAWGPSGALLLQLTGRVHPLLRLGGVLRAGAMGAPRTAFVDELEAQATFGMGPTLRLVPKDGARGPYGGLWAGFATNHSRGLGWAAGLDVGYRLVLGGGWSLGVGVALVTEWAFDGEDGDHGRYEYLQRSLLPALQVRLSGSLDR